MSTGADEEVDVEAQSPSSSRVALELHNHSLPHLTASPHDHVDAGSTQAAVGWGSPHTTAAAAAPAAHSIAAASDLSRHSVESHHSFHSQRSRWSGPPRRPRSSSGRRRYRRRVTI